MSTRQRGSKYEHKYINTQDEKNVFVIFTRATLYNKKLYLNNVGQTVENKSMEFCLVRDVKICAFSVQIYIRCVLSNALYVCHTLILSYYFNKLWYRISQSFCVKARGRTYDLPFDQLSIDSIILWNLSNKFYNSILNSSEGTVSSLYANFCCNIAQEATSKVLSMPTALGLRGAVECQTSTSSLFLTPIWHTERLY